MVALVVTHVAEYLFATVVLMGILQMLFAVAKFGKLIRMVPHPVMLGFVNGLAIVIFMAQFGHFKTMGATARRASACTCVISARIAWSCWKKPGTWSRSTYLKTRIIILRITSWDEVGGFKPIVSVADMRWHAVTGWAIPNLCGLEYCTD